MLGTVLLLLVLVIAVVAYRRNGRQSQSDMAVLRHTIAVNLQILEGELAELEPLAEEPPLTSAKTDAKCLLADSRAAATAIRSGLNEAGEAELQDKLGAVFAAMNNSTTARKLLNACRTNR